MGGGDRARGLLSGGSAFRLVRASPHSARAQAAWIVAEEPWCSLGYDQGRLGRWLARCARSDDVRLARGGPTTLGLVVTRPDVLLGVFIALLAVRPEARGRGLGRLLVEGVARRMGRRRWLYASSDSQNRGAARFYRGLGFERVGRLPDLIQRGRAEILWRRPGVRVKGAS
jgi:ribosomal protein S18 acetylase RimI-like enzyme